MSSLELRVRRRGGLAIGCVLFVAVGCGTKSCVQPPPPGPANVLTQHNDNQRTGVNLRETVLTPATVKSGGFHKLFSYVLDGQPYAQPLYVHGLDFGGGVKRNVMYIATMHNTVYAFDADHPTRASSPIWSTNLGPAFVPPRGDAIGGCHDHPNIDPVAGITSTPVIDLNRGVIYLSAKTRKVHACAWDDQEWEYGVHALDLRTGIDAIPSTSVCDREALFRMCNTLLARRTASIVPGRTPHPERRSQSHLRVGAPAQRCSGTTQRRRNTPHITIVRRQ